MQPRTQTAINQAAFFPGVQFLNTLVNEKNVKQFEQIKAQIAPHLEVHFSRWAGTPKKNDDDCC